MRVTESFKKWVSDLISAAEPIGPRSRQVLETFRETGTLDADPDEVRTAEQLARTPEYAQYLRFFPEGSRNGELALMGLRMREEQEDQQAVDRLLQEIGGPRRVQDRRVAQAFQCGAVEHLLRDLAQRGLGVPQQTRIANEFLDDIDAHAHFVLEFEGPEQVAAIARAALMRNRRAFYLVAGSGRAARSARDATELIRLHNVATHQPIEHENHPNSFMALFIPVGD